MLSVTNWILIDSMGVFTHRENRAVGDDYEDIRLWKKVKPDRRVPICHSSSQSD